LASVSAGRIIFTFIGILLGETKRVMSFVMRDAIPHHIIPKKYFDRLAEVSLKGLADPAKRLSIHVRVSTSAKELPQCCSKDIYL
jgi:hypothetical protein